ncbi:hypothetical protein KIPB_012143 [Kipferlia bialata]|uniref:Uncharacterized protein n=1 Tax=Kipferlia bialata TaxID=797122 RepID=A0A9K3D715_9EUKA|nr:hypothetical protein KIPB_012143 [Kipferlia bialata]|eukprot:g12143.t1
MPHPQEPQPTPNQDAQFHRSVISRHHRYTGVVETSHPVTGNQKRVYSDVTVCANTNPSRTGCLPTVDGPINQRVTPSRKSKLPASPKCATPPCR